MSKIKTIFIANLAEISLNLLAYMTPQEVDEEISEDHALSDRFTFSLKDNSILITPHFLDKGFFNDSVQLLGLKNAINLSPRNVKYSICNAILKDKEFFDKLSKLIKNNPGISLISYSGTTEFFELVDKLKSKNLQFKTPEIPQKENRWVSSFFDSKSGFRQAVSTFGPQFPSLPKGAISSDRKEIIGWASHLLKTSSGCVVKANRGLAGAGLQIIKKEEIKNNTSEKFVAQVLHKHKYFQQETITVEEFIPPDLSTCGGAPNIELQIANGKVISLYTCSMRVTPQGVFLGVEMGRDAVPEKISQQLKNAGQQFGKELLEFGYNGFFEIDFVAGIDKKLYAIESNLRRTGGTHAYEMVKTLLGNNALEGNYFVTNNRASTNKFRGASYQHLKNELIHFLYPIGNQKRGIILTIISNLSRGRLGYIVIGKDKDETLSIERKLHQLLN